MLILIPVAAVCAGPCWSDAPAVVKLRLDGALGETISAQAVRRAFEVVE